MTRRAVLRIVEDVAAFLREVDPQQTVMIRIRLSGRGKRREDWREICGYLVSLSYTPQGKPGDGDTMGEVTICTENGKHTVPIGWDDMETFSASDSRGVTIVSVTLEP